MFFLSLLNAATTVVDDNVGPSPESLIASYDAALQTLAQDVGVQPLAIDYSENIAQLKKEKESSPSDSALLSQIAEMQKQIDALNSAPAPSQGTVTAVTATAPVVSSEGTEPDISMAAASSTTDGYLTSTDWNTFNSKSPVAAPVTYTANFSVAATDVWIINNKSGSSCTATLPAASSYSGRVLRFQNYQAQTLISASSNVVPLVGGAAGTAILAAVAGETCTLVSDGSNWLMTQYTPNNVLLLE
jgi:hypothetical protein